MIELKNISFLYESGEREAGLRNINLYIKQGEVVLLCGESGCGKTTLTRLMNGLIPHYYEGKLSGDILIEGKRINELPLYETAKMVGSVFQNPRSQFFNVDTTSEIAFGCENQGLPVEVIRQRVAETVTEMGIEDLMDRSLFKLSGGEKQKIACASVSACHPDIFVLDEPSSNLDAASIDELRRLIGIWKEAGKTVVIAEHRLYFLRQLVDQIVYMKAGEISEILRSEDLEQMDNAKLAEKGLRPFDMARLKYDAALPAAGNEKIKLNDFVFSYEKKIISLNIPSLDIPQGSITALIGHNGAGKSTFARCICGLEKKCRGTMEDKGNIRRGRQRLSECYMVMQDVNHQLFTESVLEEVLLSMHEPDDEKALDILGELDLLQFKDFHPMSLSGGQKQRVAIASAVASERSVILFDEPTSGLDLRHMKEVANVLIYLQKMGKTIFVISHDPELILSCCNHVLHLERGRVEDEYPLNKANTERLLDFFFDQNSEKWMPA